MGLFWSSPAPAPARPGRCRPARAARPALITCAEEHDQSVQVCEQVLEHREQGVPLRRQAVLFRTGHHSDLLELELVRRNVPFVKYGGLKFLESAHVKDVLAVLRLLENPRDEVSWFRVLQLLEGIGPASARSIMHALGVRSSTSSTPLQVLLESPPRVPDAARDAFEELRSAIRDCLANGGGLPPSAEVARIRRFCEPIIQQRYSSPQARLQDVDQLEHVAGRTPRALDFSVSSRSRQSVRVLSPAVLSSTARSGRCAPFRAAHALFARAGAIAVRPAQRWHTNFSSGQWGVIRRFVGGLPARLTKISGRMPLASAMGRNAAPAKLAERIEPNRVKSACAADAPGEVGAHL